MESSRRTMQQFPSSIKRFAAPSVFDHAPHGTICFVNDQLYIQMSPDEERPFWNLYEGTYEHAKEFVIDLLKQDYL